MKRLHRLLLVLGTVCVAGMLLPAARAQDAKPGCDPEFMDAVEAKAYLGVQRRITQNQNLIVKPDSVLEYSCFNQQLTWLASNPGRRFSENKPAYPTWGNVTAVNDKTLDYALFEVITKPLISYLGANFSHTYLGGRMVDPGGAAPASSGNFDCKAMQAVWVAARCIDFMEDDSGKYVPGDDGFYDFPWYKSKDPRRLPTVYAACKAPDNLGDAIVNSYKASGDDSGQEYKLFVEETENDPAMDDTKYEEDPITVEGITDKMIPGECKQSLKIPTGVKVAVPGRSPREYDETVCLTPGCSYNGKDCSFD